MNNLRHIFASALLALGTLAPQGSYASIVDDSVATETVAITLKGLSICHQREWRHLSVNLEFVVMEGQPATDVNSVKHSVRLFFDLYSSEDDFWEIMNTKLVRYLSVNFPEMVSIRSALCLAPDSTLNNHRKSIVKFDRGYENLSEEFMFLKSGYLICQKTFRALDLRVTWRMVPDPDPASGYPDYLWIDAAIDAFFHEHPVSFSEWSLLKPKLLEHLIAQYPTLATVEIDVSVAE